MIGLLREAYKHLIEHNQEYKHRTPQVLLDRIENALRGRLDDEVSAQPGRLPVRLVDHGDLWFDVDRNVVTMWVRAWGVTHSLRLDLWNQIVDAYRGYLAGSATWSDPPDKAEKLKDLRETLLVTADVASEAGEDRLAELLMSMAGIKVMEKRLEDFGVLADEMAIHQRGAVHGSLPATNYVRLDQVKELLVAFAMGRTGR